MPTSRFATGLVLGKFMPPHHGHRVVINAALAQSESVIIVISVLPDDVIPAEQRMTWLKQLYPSTTVVMMPVTWNVADAQAWTDGVRRAAGKQPDAVFSSEHYGHQLAELLGCQHIQIDRDRKIVPISATEIRHNPAAYQEYLDPIVAAYFKY